MPKNKKQYAIGIVASPRQTSFLYQAPNRNSSVPGTGTFAFSRGTYQATGHTAIYLREDEEFKLVRGFVPNGLINAIRAVVFGSSVQGKWQDDIVVLQLRPC